MANSFSYKDKQFKVGDTVSLNYKIREGDKERTQIFRGILININGASEAVRMITVRKISHSGVGVEKIVPLSSPFLTSISLVKKSNYQKAKAYFIRNLSNQQLKSRLYRKKTK